MTTQEKLIMILSEGWEIKIYARHYPLDKHIQGYLQKHQIYTSETPFCISYIATKGDQTIVDIYHSFDEYINMVYVVLAGEKAGVA